MIREQIDIEALLIRTYREKAVDRFGHSNDRQRRIISRLIAGSAPRSGGFGFGIGLGVQTSGFAPSMAAREAHLWKQMDFAGDTLLAVHDAVLGLPTLYYEPLGDLDFQVWDAQTALHMGHRITVEAGAARVERVRRRGGGDPKRADELRPAGPARRVVPIVATTLLICHGRKADRPFVPDIVVTGRRPLYKGASKRAIAHEPVYETPLARVVEDRAIYATWHACLGLLAAVCTHLPDLDVTGPLAPSMPWDAAPAIDLAPMPRARSVASETTPRTKHPVEAMPRPIG